MTLVANDASRSVTVTLDYSEITLLQTGVAAAKRMTSNALSGLPVEEGSLARSMITDLDAMETSLASVRSKLDAAA